MRFVIDFYSVFIEKDLCCDFKRDTVFFEVAYGFFFILFKL